MSKLQAYLDYPIPRKVVFGLLAANGFGCFVLGQLSVYSRADKQIKDQQERIHIFNETNEFLLNRADDATLVELDKQLDYWRVILGIDPVDRD